MEICSRGSGAGNPKPRRQGPPPLKALGEGPSLLLQLLGLLPRHFGAWPLLCVPVFSCLTGTLVTGLRACPTLV